MSLEQLAIAVIRQAVSDAQSTAARRRISARAFLARRGEGLDYWAAVAGVDAELVRTRARRLGLL